LDPRKALVLALLGMPSWIPTMDLVFAPPLVVILETEKALLTWIPLGAETLIPPGAVMLALPGSPGALILALPWSLYSLLPSSLSKNYEIM